MSDLKLGYLGVQSSKREEWLKFAEVCAFGVGEDSDAETLFLRVDDQHHRIAVHAGPGEGVQYIGWDTGSQTVLDDVLTRLAARGVAVEEASTELVDQRRVLKLYRFRDTNGFETELFFGPRVVSTPLRTSTPMRGHFETGDQGLGHIVLNCPDIAGSSAFYKDVLGFRLTDSVRGAENIEFLRCNPRHHSAAFFEAPAPASFQHLMIQVEELDDVGRAYDRAQKQMSDSIVATLGRHNVEQMVSFYVRTPSDFLIEIGWGAVRVDDEASWAAKTYDPPSLWGHQWLEDPAS